MDIEAIEKTEAIEAIINDIEEQIIDCKKCNESLDEYSWSCEEGVLLSANDAIRIVEHIKQLRLDAERYRYLRDRDLDTIEEGGLFAGMTPDNVVLNGGDLDQEIDKAITAKNEN